MVCMVAIGLCSLFTSTANAHEIPPVLQGGVRVGQINVASINSSQSSTGTRIHLGILSERLHEQDKATGVIIVRDECKAAIGDPEHCTVTVFRRFCRVVSTSPYIEQCYWTASHHLQGTWDEKKQCCDVLVDGRKFCAKGAIYQPF